MLGRISGGRDDALRVGFGLRGRLRRRHRWIGRTRSARDVKRHPGGTSLDLARLHGKTDATHDRCLGQEGIRQDVIKSALSVYANACVTGAQNAFMRVKQGQSKTANGPFSDGLPSDKPYLYMNVAGMDSGEN